MGTSSSVPRTCVSWITVMKQSNILLNQQQFSFKTAIQGHVSNWPWHEPHFRCHIFIRDHPLHHCFFRSSRQWQINRKKEQCGRLHVQINMPTPKESTHLGKDAWCVRFVQSFVAQGGLPRSFQITRLHALVDYNASFNLKPRLNPIWWNGMWEIAP